MNRILVRLGVVVKRGNYEVINFFNPLTYLSLVVGFIIVFLVSGIKEGAEFIKEFVTLKDEV